MEVEKKEMRGYEKTTLTDETDTDIIPLLGGKNKWYLLGHTQELEYVFYKDGEVFIIDPERFSVIKIQMFFGVDKSTAQGIRGELPELASEHVIDTKNTIGNGVYKGSNDKEFIIVNGANVIKAEYDSITHKYKITKETTPIVDGKLLDLKGSREWLDTDELLKIQESIKGDKETLREQFEEIRKTVSYWNWESPEMADYITAFVMLAPFQRLMSWRPSLWITGHGGTGKTLFFERVLQKLYGNLTIRLDNSTDYGAIQRLNSTSQIALLDNFEHDKRSEKFMKTFEIANRGGDIVRGTTTKEPINFKLEHMVWYNAVTLVTDTRATDSRIVEFHLVNPLNDVPELPSEVSAEKIIYSMLDWWSDIEEEKKMYIKSDAESKKDTTSTNSTVKRSKENIGYAQALLRKLEIIDPSDLSSLDVPNFIKTRATVDESMELLKAILTSSVLPDDASDYSEQAKKFVYEAIQENPRSIVRKGVWKVHDRDGTDWIAIEPTSVKRELLKAPEYTQRTPEQIKKMLLNLEGAKMNTSKNAVNKSIYAVYVPIKYIEQFEVMYSNEPEPESEPEPEPEQDEQIGEDGYPIKAPF